MPSTWICPSGARNAPARAICDPSGENFTPNDLTPTRGGFLSATASQDPAGNALRPALLLSQMPNPSRRKDWGDPRSLRIRRIELSEVRCGYDGLALAHWLRSFGLASSSADISAKNTSGSSPEIAESLRSLNTSPGSTGLGGVP